MCVPMGGYEGVLVGSLLWPPWSHLPPVLPSLPFDILPSMVLAELLLQDVVEGTRAQRLA